MMKKLHDRFTIQFNFSKLRPFAPISKGIDNEHARPVDFSEQAIQMNY
jgi:hypothetical protein